MKRLPWNVGEYARLEPNDLLPHPEPTPEQRIRVAACVATIIRDEVMLGLPTSGNHEMIRALLTMPPEAWARDIEAMRNLKHPVLGSVLAYDHVDPKTRFDQTVNARKN